MVQIVQSKTQCDGSCGVIIKPGAGCHKHQTGASLPPLLLPAVMDNQSKGPCYQLRKGENNLWTRQTPSPTHSRFRLCFREVFHSFIWPGLGRVFSSPGGNHNLERLGERLSRMRTWTRRTLSSPQSIFLIITSNPRLAETFPPLSSVQHQSLKWCVELCTSPLGLNVIITGRAGACHLPECREEPGARGLPFSFFGRVAQTCLWKGFHSHPLWIEFL